MGTEMFVHYAKGRSVVQTFLDFFASLLFSSDEENPCSSTEQ